MFSKRILKLLAVYFLVAMGPLPALAISCEALLARVTHSKYAEEAQKIFTDQTSKELIRKLSPKVRDYLEEGVGSHKSPKFEVIFNEYMRARMESLPPEVRENLEKTLKNLKVKSFKPSVLKKEISGGARDLFGFMQLSVSMPDYLHGTIIDYAVRVHELEHIIQIYSVGMGASAQYLFPHFVSDRHAVEEGAMNAEATFLALFPRELLKSLFFELTETSKSSKLAIKMLGNSLLSQSTSEYIERNWQQGRYSTANLVAYQMINYALFPGAVVPIVILSHIFGF